MTDRRLVRSVASRYLRVGGTSLFFHGTSSTFLEGIRRRGLRAGTSEKVWEGDVEALEDRVYLTRGVGVAARYAASAVSKFGGDPLVLVFRRDPSELDMGVDEDLILDLLHKLSEQDLIWSRFQWTAGEMKAAMDDLLLLLEKVPKDAEPLSRRHLGLVASVEAMGDVRASLGEMMDAAASPEVSGPAKLEMKAAEPSEIPDLIRDRTVDLWEHVESRLKTITVTPGTSASKAAEFVAEGVPAFVSDTAKGNRADWFRRHRESLSEGWPEWFGREAAMRNEVRPNVAVRAESLVPDEGYVVEGGVSSYQELKGGRRVI